MKNLNLLPTDKPSRLFKDDNQVLNLHTHSVLKGIFTNGIGSNQHIYITNSEEIKEGDWCIMTNDFGDNYLVKVISLKCIGGPEIRVLLSLNNQENTSLKDKCKKIILTTDQDLIKDGVQKIDDEFLEWFVKNPSCEEVEILRCPIEGLYTIDLRKLIPKKEPKQIKCYCGHTTYCDCDPEEPKQETLEEAAKDFVLSHDFSKLTNPNHLANRCFQFGAKWQQERMYSEEDMVKFAEFVATYLDKNRNVNGEMLHAKSKYDGAERTIDLLEQFKKK